MADPIIPTTEQREILQSILKLQKDQAEALEKQVSEYGKVVQQLRYEEEHQKKIKELQESTTQEYKDQEESLQRVQKQIKQLEDQKKAGLQVDEDKIKKLLELREIEQDLFDDEKKRHDERVAQIKKEMEDLKKLSDANEKDIEKRRELQKKLAKETFEGIKSFASAMTEGFNLPLLGTRIKGFREILTDIIKAPAEAFKKFGFLSDSYVQSIGQMRQGLAEFGITEKDMYDAVGELNQGLADFSSYSTDTQKSLINTTTKLGQAGFAAGKTTAAMLSLTKVFGQTGTQAESTVKRIAALSLTLGQGQKGLDDFISLSPKLVGFGNRAEKVFTDTAIAAKKLGMDTQELFDLMGQYDSFEKAANAAGELNLALGGQFVDSLDLMKASLEGGTTDVLKQLQDAFNKSGTSVDNLTRSQIKYFASAAGMKEDQFMKVFRNGGQGVEAYIREQEEAAKKQENLNEIAKKTQDIFQQLQNAFVAAFSDQKTIDSFVATVKDLAKFIKEDIVPAFKWIASNSGLMKSFFVIGPLVAFATTLIGIVSTMRQISALGGSIRAATAALQALQAGGTAGGAASLAGGAGAAAAAPGAGFLGTGGALLGTAGAAILGGAAIGGLAGMGINKYFFGVDIEGNKIGPEQERARAAILAARGPATPVQDAVAPGGSIITTPQGGRMITSAQDSVIAAKEGGILAQKLDILISKIDELGARPIMMDGKKVNSVLAEANRYNPFVA